MVSGRDNGEESAHGSASGEIAVEKEQKGKLPTRQNQENRREERSSLWNRGNANNVGILGWWIIERRNREESRALHFRFLLFRSSCDTFYYSFFRSRSMINDRCKWWNNVERIATVLFPLSPCGYFLFFLFPFHLLYCHKYASFVFRTLYISFLIFRLLNGGRKLVNAMNYRD